MEDFEKNDIDKISTNQILECSDLQDITDNDIESEEHLDTTEDSFIVTEFEEIQNNNQIESTIEQPVLDSENNVEKLTTDTASTTNCLALTIKEEHKLVAVKNVFLHSLKVSWKVVASTIALHILKIFF